MPLIILALFLLNALSLLILGGAGWFGWTWYEGIVVQTPDGDLARVREDWRLWLALGLLAWSFLGRFVVLSLLAKPDGAADPSRARRSEGRQIEGHAGASLYVETTGPATAPTLVLIHGWGLDSTIWFLLRRTLGNRYRIIAWDLPGLGRSRRGSSKTLCLTDFAENLKRVMATAGGPVVLVGHSIGGMTIQTLARDAPELFGRDVAGVVLVNTTYTNPLRTMIFSGFLQAIRRPVLEPVMGLMIVLQPLVWLGAWQGYLSGSAHIANRLGFGRFVTRSQLDHTALLPTRNPPAVQGRGNMAMFRWDATGAVARISPQVPVLVLAGELDIITKAEASRTIVSSAPQSRLSEVTGVNHMGFLERSDVYCAEIASFVDSLARPADTAQASSAYLCGRPVRAPAAGSPTTGTCPLP